ncbi:uncharacterized protein [Arachis hypogaea]|uniref:uncharacterized protein n=1 Tax=Arachis hypogaea TaxID=3818 RepID=UPI003B21FAAE
MKQAADKKRRDVTFEGDFVFLKIHPYMMQSLATRPNQKLGARFYGPYEVLEKIGPAAYKLRLPPSAKIHLIFYVSQLKKSLGLSVEPQNLPEALTEKGELLVEPEQILDSCMRNQENLEVLIKWQNLPKFKSTWELADKLQFAFPSFHLEDKVALHWGGIITSQER